MIVPSAITCFRAGSTYSESLWSTAFRRDHSIIGQRVVSVEHGAVVGVLPETFRGVIFANVLARDFWVPRAAATASAA